MRIEDAVHEGVVEWMSGGPMADDGDVLHHAVCLRRKDGTLLSLREVRLSAEAHAAVSMAMSTGEPIEIHARSPGQGIANWVYGVRDAQGFRPMPCSASAAFRAQGWMYLSYAIFSAAAAATLILAYMALLVPVFCLAAGMAFARSAAARPRSLKPERGVPHRQKGTATAVA